MICRPHTLATCRHLTNYVSFLSLWHVGLDAHTLTMVLQAAQQLSVR